MLENLSLSTYLLENPILTLTFIAHFLADFQWQSQSLADKKVYSKAALNQHLVIVAIPLLICLLIDSSAWNFLSLALFSHILIDYAKFYLAPIISAQDKDKYIFLIDQLLHYTAIVASYNLLKPATSDWLESNSQLIQIALFLLLITKPVNIAFKLFFSKYQVQTASEEEDETIVGAGALIGNLERLTMGILLILGQFAAIALVFTAKSIARYDKISKNQAFAEYYLIGSLFSIISVLIIYFLFS
ncbi:DUF3307 domain-containing protein [Streptococcus dentapri]|uniref:DUF3307 domain-containing protein n=1 Tax=Streptococcus dentapri TaxID=573564 RepID=A0ABV8D098_9STRE